MLMPNAKLSLSTSYCSCDGEYYFFGPFSSRIEKEGKKKKGTLQERPALATPPTASHSEGDVSTRGLLSSL